MRPDSEPGKRITETSRALYREIVRLTDPRDQFAATCAVICGLLVEQSDEAAESVFQAVRDFRKAAAAAGIAGASSSSERRDQPLRARAAVRSVRRPGA